MKKILFLMFALVAMATTAMAQSDATWSVKLIKAGDQKLEVIKVVKEDLGLGLKEAKDLVESAPCMLLENVEEEPAEALAKKLRNLGATVTLLHNGIDVTLDDNDGSLWSVRLDEVGSQKTEVVKAVREETGLGLKEAKDLVDSAPCIVLENVVQERAEAFAQKLRAIGATVTVQIVQVAINATNFPDENFRSFLLAQDYGKDAILTNEEIAAVKNMFPSKGIKNLKGIEFFTELKKLDCRYNQLTSLDVSKNTALTNLLCTGNQLTSLDVSANTELTELECSENKLTELNVSQNKKLTSLWCDANQIKGEKMQALVESLPEVTSGNFGVIDTKNSNEGNVCTKSQVAIAKSKGWKVSDYNGGKYQYYEGSDDPTTDPKTLSVTFTKAATLAAALSKEERLALAAVFTLAQNKKLSGYSVETQSRTITALKKGKKTLILQESTATAIKGFKVPDDVTSADNINVTLTPNLREALTTDQATQLASYDAIQIKFDTTTGLTAVESGQLTVDSWYSIDGVKLQGEPTKKGVYIYKGKKVVKK